MPPQFEAPIIREKKQLTPRERVLVGILLVLIILLSGAAIWYFGKTSFLQPKVVSDPSSEVDKEIARILTEAESKEFTFVLVPDAATIITLPSPTSSVDAVDAESYRRFKATTTIPQADVENDVAFNLPFMGSTFIGYINSIDTPDEIHQIIDESHELTLQLNKHHNRPPLKERIEGVVQLAPLDPIVPGSEVRSVYPSIRAVDAYVAFEIMVRIDPDNAQKYEADTSSLINRGIGYGLYGISDAEAARTLVSEYMAEFTKPAVAVVATDN